jgi:hypothetical protein
MPLYGNGMRAAMGEGLEVGLDQWSFGWSGCSDSSNWEVCLKNILIASLFMVMTIAPWTYRNWTILYAWVPVSTKWG